MNEFRAAITWRGVGQLSFIAYGIWERAAAEAAQKGIVEDLVRIAPEAQVSPFVATDETWPIDVGVLDVETSKWPDEPEQFCEAILSSMCRQGARVSWMMFDGVFNDVSDIFSDHWAAQVYAIKADCRLGEVRTAIADEVRHAPEWKQFVLGCRQRLISEYPAIEGV